MSDAPKIAGRAELLGLSRRRYRDVPIPEVGLTFRIQSLTEGEKSRYESETLTKRGTKGYRARLEASRRKLVCLVAVDGDGKLLFPNTSDLEALVEVDGIATGRIYNAALEHCGYTEADIEELVGNSDETTGDAS